MEEIWEAQIHTLDVGQGDSSLIQIKKLRKIEIEPEEYLELYEEETLGGYKAGSARVLPVRHVYRFEEKEILDTVWEYKILIDGGEEGQEEKVLRCINENIKFCLNAVIITHADSDHYGGVYDMLAKNNFWHLCKDVYFTVGQQVIGFLDGLKPTEMPEDWQEPVRKMIEPMVTEIVTGIVDDLLIFAVCKKKEKSPREDFIGNFINGIGYVINELEDITESFEEFVEEVQNFFHNTKENEYAAKFLYRKMMEDGNIRKAVGTGLAVEGYEIHTGLPSDLVIYVSALAWAELFGGGRKFKEEIYTGRRIAQGIAVREESKWFGMYGVQRKMITLSVNDIGRDFMESAAGALEPDVFPVKMVLAAVDQYADCDKKQKIIRDSNKKNCSSIATLLQAGIFLYYSGGDLPKDGEAAMAKNYFAEKYKIMIPIPGESEYYMGFKTGHHGSVTATSGEFLDAFQPRYAVISCGDHTGGSGKTFEFPARQTVFELIGRECIQNIFTTAYPNVEPEEMEQIEASGKVVVTGFFSDEPEESRYNRSGDMVCTVQIYGPEEARECSIQMEAYEGEAADCIWRTYPLFWRTSVQQDAVAAHIRKEEKTPFVLIPGMLEFEDISPLEEGVEGFTAEFLLGGKRLDAKFANLRKWNCYEGTLSVADHQVLGLGDLLQWAGAIFPNLQIFSEQKQWKLDNLGIESIYLYWNAWVQRIVMMKWNGRGTVEAFDFYVSLIMPEYEMELKLLPNQKLTVEDCLTKAGLPEGVLGFLGKIGLAGLTLRVSLVDQAFDEGSVSTASVIWHYGLSGSAGWRTGTFSAKDSSHR